MPQRSNSARYLYGDRNPLSQNQIYLGSGIAPHGATQRFAYTVPTNRKAILQEVFARTYLTAVAAPAGFRVGYIDVLVAAIQYWIVMAEIGPDKNTVGNDAINLVGPGMVLLSGQILEGYTQDNSTGGTMSYTLSAIVTEYDS